MSVLSPAMISQLGTMEYDFITEYDIYLRVIREVRSYAIRHNQGCYTRSDAPVYLIEGKSAPHWRGHSFRYTTKTGKPVHHPNAYRKAWGKPVYVQSSRRIEVGREWVKQLRIDTIKVAMIRKYRRFSVLNLLAFA